MFGGSWFGYSPVGPRWSRAGKSMKWSRRISEGEKQPEIAGED
jgi:hypothetical protein